MPWLKATGIVMVFWAFMAGLVWLIVTVPSFIIVLFMLCIFGVSVHFVHSILTDKYKDDPW